MYMGDNMTGAGSGDEKPDPSKPSGDYEAMCPDWDLIADIRAGQRRIKAQGARYLPKYEKEGAASYATRLLTAPWRPEFVDALEGMTSKPFATPIAVTVNGQPLSDAGPIRDIIQDIDGRGADLHGFARNTFTDGVANGLAGIYVTYPNTSPDPLQTKAEEIASKLRPYWVALAPRDILACYTDRIAGREIITHIRFRESVVRRTGFKEVAEVAVRVIELDSIGRVVSQLWKQDPESKEWAPDEPVLLEGVTEIPIVLFFTGERFGSYGVRPPLADLAYLQLELYRAGAREDEILTYAGSPMLKARGLADPTTGRALDGGPLPSMTVGPRITLFAPQLPDGTLADWEYLSPNADNLRAIRENVDSIVQDFRRLAKQPLTPQSGGITATATAIDGARAHSALQAWAENLSNVLERALAFTVQWMGTQDKIKARIDTDWAADLADGADMDALLKIRMSGDLSRETFWSEIQRRGKLSPDFDATKEQLRLEEEAPAFDPRLSVSALAEEAQLHGSNVGPGGLASPALTPSNSQQH